jgi:hypothetical protein
MAERIVGVAGKKRRISRAVPFLRRRRAGRWLRTAPPPLSRDDSGAHGEVRHRPVDGVRLPFNCSCRGRRRRPVRSAALGTRTLGQPEEGVPEAYPRPLGQLQSGTVHVSPITVTDQKKKVTVLCTEV